MDSLIECAGGNWDGWSFWSPRPALSPESSVEGKSLYLAGKGNRHCFGGWVRRVSVKPGRAYRLRTVLRCSGVDDIFLHVTPHVVWRRGELPEKACAKDAIREFRQEGDQFVGEDTFVAPDNCESAEIRLLLRFAPEGEIWFDQVSFSASELPPARLLRVGTMKFKPPKHASLDEHLLLYAEQVDRLGAAEPDLIVLPEFANTSSSDPEMDVRERAEPPDGPFCTMLQEKAKTFNCYICAGVLELDGEFVFNSAMLYDRNGRLVGKQRKVHPYWPEEPLGISPGNDFEVFETEFGTVGIMICYDSWFPETARLLALKGAELILFPNAGYEERILPARAIDNNVYIVASTLNSPAAIVTPTGDLLAVSAVDNVLTAEIDLNDRPKCSTNAGGNLSPGPGGARWARNANSTRMYEDILAEVKNGVLET